MSLLYRGLRQVLSLALELYYVDIQSTGRANVPAEGPLIFAANHPNSIMDTVLLGTQTSRAISYMAKSGLFRNPLVAWLFRECGVIPIHRNPKQSGANEDAFRSAYALLEQGGTIGIFPEGRNSGEREMHEIKTGTARIALGAERRNDYGLGVRILPVGLNFENRDRFLSSVLVRFGEPIDVTRYADQHREAEREAVRALTAEVQQQLRDLATHIEGDRVRDLVQEIHTIYGRRLLEAVTERREQEKRQAHVMFDDLRAGDFDDQPLLEDMLDEYGSKGLRERFFGHVKWADDSENLDEQMFLKKRISEAIAYYEEQDPALVREMKLRVWRFKDHLRQVQLRHDIVDRPPETLSFRKEAFKLTLYALVFALPALWGFVHNVIPYLATKFAALHARDEPQRAITGLIAGAVAYPLAYAGPIFGVWELSGHSPWWTLLYAVSLPFTGFFFLRYRRQLARYRDRVLVRTMFQTERNLLESLIEEREELLEMFDGLRERFLEAEEERELLESTPPPADDAAAPAQANANAP